MTPQIHVEVSNEFAQQFDAARKKLSFGSRSEALRYAMRGIIEAAKDDPNFTVSFSKRRPHE